MHPHIFTLDSFAIKQRRPAFPHLQGSAAKGAAQYSGRPNRASLFTLPRYRVRLPPPLSLSLSLAVSLKRPSSS